MITTQSIKFSFRNKFESLLTDKNRQSINSAFQKFCSMSPNDAKEALWKMSYNGLDPSFYIYKELGIQAEVEELPSEKISILRNELRYQYEKLHPGFMDVDVPDACQEAFKALEGRADIIAATVVYEHCQWHWLMCEEERVLFLLQNEEERNYYGGIRSLGFYPDEAAYLKPFHVQIYNLFKVYCDCMKQYGKCSANKPFAGLDKLVQEAGLELTGGTQEEEGKETAESQQTPKEDKQETDEPKPEHDESKQEATETQRAQDETEKEEPVQPSSEFKPLTANEIKGHEDVFMLFLETGDLNDLVRIGELGFDLNKVVTKKEEIRKFLQAEEAKIKALGALNEADEAKKRAARAFAESIKDLSDAAKALEE